MQHELLLAELSWSGVETVIQKREKLRKMDAQFLQRLRRRWILPKTLLLTPKGVRRRRLVRGEFVWSLQGGEEHMLDGWVPRSMRASAPRPLALAGVTRSPGPNQYQILYHHIGVIML